MKSPASVIITLSFLLWLSFTTTKPSLVSAAYEVVDSNGDPLVPGEQYYIVSSIRGGGGGGVRPTRTGSCSYSIIQEKLDLMRGVPVKFHVPVISTATTNLEIEFVWKPDCAESSKWTVAYESGSSLSSGKLVIGGPQDHPNSELVSGVFQIKNFADVAYHLVFCPESNATSSSSDHSCYYIGRDFQNVYRQLVLLNDRDESPFSVSFVKAGNSGDGKSIV